MVEYLIPMVNFPISIPICVKKQSVFVSQQLFLHLTTEKDKYIKEKYGWSKLHTVVVQKINVK